MEIEEMIRMCDADGIFQFISLLGSGCVNYEEFKLMALGLSLAPIG